MNTINAELNLDESDDESDTYRSNESNEINNDKSNESEVCMTKSNNV